MRPVGSRRIEPWRRLLAALVLAIAPIVSHVTAPSAAAIFDCNGHLYCGALNISLSGSGDGEAVSDPAGDDCVWTGATHTASGTCSYLFVWDDSPSTYVDVTITPTASSFACVPTCLGAGQAIGTTSIVYNQQVTTSTASFIKATALTITLSPAGDGSGRITSNPTGIDCGEATGATSGTCSHTWYANGSINVGLTYTPDPGSAACTPTCGPVGSSHWFNVGAVSTSSVTYDYGFQLGHPIVTVAVQGKGKVTSTPAGISCPSTCSSYFAPATSLNLKATPASGYVLTGWSGSCSGTGIVTTCILALGSADVSATAIFAKQVTPPPPTPTPRPTPTLRPGVTPGPTPIATSSASPGSSVTEASPAGSEPPGGASAGPATSGAPTQAPMATAGGSGGPAASPNDGPAAATGPDVGGVAIGVAIGVVVALVLVIGLGAGFLAGRRRRSDGGDTP